jgi:hypothetical protein
VAACYPKDTLKIYFNQPFFTLNFLGQNPPSVSPLVYLIFFPARLFEFNLFIWEPFDFWRALAEPALEFSELSRARLRERQALEALQ